jgi:hypothetical protein
MISIDYIQKLLLSILLLIIIVIITSIIFKVNWKLPVILIILLIGQGVFLYRKITSNACPPCICNKSNNIFAAYYTFYQDPNCSDKCKPKPCTSSILSEKSVLESKLNLIIINPIAPATDGGVTLSYINNVYTGESSQSNTYYDPPAAIKKGIDDLHAAGKKVTLSFIPGGAKDRWGMSDDWMEKFKNACQNIMTKWDIDGFDWDCETDGCPPKICGGDWAKLDCQKNALDIFKTLKSLKPNKNRGNDCGEAIVTWTAELTWQIATLDNVGQYMPYIDYFLTMNENYSITDPKVLYKNMVEFSKKGCPINKIVNGVKVGGCWPITNGDGANIDSVKNLLTTKIEGNKTLSDIGAGWVIWNLSRDYGCKYGRTNDFEVGTDYDAKGKTSKTCKTCKTGPCPIGTGGFSAGEPWAFLHGMQDIIYN